MTPLPIDPERTGGAVKPHSLEMPEKQVEEPAGCMAGSNHPITHPTDIRLESALKRYAPTVRHERILAPLCRAEAEEGALRRRAACRAARGFAVSSDGEGCLTSPAVRTALLAVPRERFVPEVANREGLERVYPGPGDRHCTR